jgi:pimeloyl-ACP methyl ester carboxylesterase
MLALAYAAEHPTVPAGLVLIGCGTFSGRARAELEARLEARLTPRDRAILANLEQTEASADRRLAAQGRLMTRVCGHDIEDDPDQIAEVDSEAHEQTWADMLRLQQDGVYPAAFAAIDVPVLMLHGAQDPHPGRLIRDDLQVFIPHLEYQELSQCGHSPWLERQAKRAFLECLNAWIAARFRPDGHGAA